MTIKLIKNDTGHEVNIGDTITSFRGEQETLRAVYPLDGMTGKVQVGDAFSQLYYPAVFDCAFVSVEDSEGLPQIDWDKFNAN